MLCAQYLVGIAPRSLNTRDQEGDSPAHVAVRRNNVEVFRVLMNAGANINAADKGGLSCRRRAAELEHVDILNIIDSTRNVRGRDRKRRGESKQPKEVGEIDSERIMQIWEKFFENAFKAMGLEMDVDDDLQFGSNDDLHLAASAAVRALDLSPRTASAIQNSYSAHTTTATTSNGATILPAISSSISCEYRNNLAISEWFSWILCCSHHDDNGYYCVRPETGATLTLQEFYSTQTMYMLYNADTAAGCTHLSPLSSLSSLVITGWLPYFNDTTNSCFLMHLSTGHCESYVHIPGESRDGRFSHQEIKASIRNITQALVPYEQVK